MPPPTTKPPPQGPPPPPPPPLPQPLLSKFQPSPSRSQTPSAPSTPVFGTSIFSLSDELLLLIIQNLDRHADVPATRLTCRKLHALTETFFFRNIMLTLPEEVLDHQWQLKLRLMPSQVSKAKQFTVLNQRRQPGGYFYHATTICQPHSYRIMRWNLLEDISIDANAQFSKSACLVGVQFYPKLAKFSKRQLTTFRWRHAVPLSLANLTAILKRQAHTLQELEISMIQPPVSGNLRDFQYALRHKSFPNLRSFKYHGLSHTEPLPVNRPEKGGRFRMLRPLFHEFHQTVQELVLLQDHCISQVGKTPMTLGRTIFDTLCRLDDLYIDPTKTITDDQPPVTLNLTKLELGGFNVNNLFDVPASATLSPRVRLHLPSIRRLVLNDCYALDNLLRKLLARKDEIHITEFGVRVGDQNETSDELSNTYEALRDFLLCFKGLEVLSILTEGSARGLHVGKDVLAQHVDTLRAYSVAARNHDGGGDEENTLRFIAIPTDGILNKDEISPGCIIEPPALREYGTFLNKTLGREYPRLRYLSQFPDLRTVVIRNFPELTPDLKPRLEDNTTKAFWRNRPGIVTPEATRMAEIFAEQIAIPFHALPDSYSEDKNASVDDALPYPGGYVDDDLDFDVTEEEERIKSELTQIAKKHNSDRDKILGFPLKSMASSSTPKKDITRDVLKQKAKADPEFDRLMRKYKQGTASADEKQAYLNYQSVVQVALGLKAPLEGTAPKLRLLIIGDWTYRDQMNLTGPRKWDPAAWSCDDSQDRVLSEDEDDDEDDHDDSVDTDIREEWNFKTYRIRPGFKREFDVSLLPIFFEVNWVAIHDEDKGRHRWSAIVRHLRQDTLEGQRMLGDTKLLDFAWML